MGRRRDNNEGHVGRKVQKDRRRRGYVTLPDGSRQWVSGKTKEEVRSKVAELQQQLEEGRPPTGGSTTVEAWLKDWIGRRTRLGKIRMSTFVRYEEVARLHIIPRIGHMRLRAVRPGDLDHLYDRLLTEPRPPKPVRQKHGETSVLPERRDGEKLPPLSAQTVKHVHRLLHAAFKDAERRGEMLRNPTDLVDPPEQPKVAKREVDPADIVRLLKAAAGDRLEAMYWLVAGTGMRQSELFGLLWEDVDFEKGVVYVRRKARRVSVLGIMHDDPKTEAGKRTIVLPAMVIAALRQHAARQVAETPHYRQKWQGVNLVFPNTAGGYLEAGTFRERDWLPLIERAEIPYKITFHEFTRHGHASMLEHLNVDRETRRRRMGHASAETTDRFYTHPISGADAEAAQRWDRYVRELLSAG